MFSVFRFFLVAAVLASQVLAGPPTSPTEAFGNSGKQAGLEIWRVEKFTPVPVAAADFGKFHTGDSYVVLKTTEDPESGKLSFDIFFWLGKETSQDESGAAAIFTVQLDDVLGGKAKQYREVQGEESDLFLENFKGGLTILPGGVDSGFKHVETKDLPKALFKVDKSGVTKVPTDKTSVTPDDCFVLDTGKGDVLVLVGSGTKNAAKLKCTLTANSIRDQERAGRGEVTILDDFNVAADLTNFYAALAA